MVSQHETIILSHFWTRSQISKNRLTALSCLSVRPPALNNSALAGWILMKFCICISFENLSRKFKCHTRKSANIFSLLWNVMSPSHPLLLAHRLQRKLVTHWHHCWSSLLKTICISKYSHILTLSNIGNLKRKGKVYVAITLLWRRSERSSTLTRSSFW
jgi:hypothetical protein